MMRVLYFLEPTVEFGRPLFRLATIRNHLEGEIKSLANNSHLAVDVRLLCSARVCDAARREGLLDGVSVVSLSDRELKRASPDPYEASLAWFEGSYHADALARAVALYEEKLRGFVPDVIVCYESSAPFLERLFPHALLLHDTLGMFSRPPYPETSALDPYGVGRFSYLARNASSLRSLPLASEHAALLDQLKRGYRAAQSLRSPVQSATVRGGYERVVLLPLQVSRYFMYDGHCPPELRGLDQVALIRHVLERVPADVGVYASLHRADSSWVERGALNGLHKRFPNLLFDRATQSVPWPSQHVLPHMDAVVSVSSSVGLTALLWDLPVVNVGHSHLAAVASASDLAQLPRLLQAGRTRALDPVLHHLLTHYYPQIHRYHHRGDWFARFLERGVAWHRAGRVGDPFSPIDDVATVYAALVHGLRNERHTRELEVWAQKHATKSSLAQGALPGAIAAAELVSMDVFDTLLTRPFLTPRTVFRVISHDVLATLAEHGIDVRGLDFAALRERAIPYARAAAAQRGDEEYELTDVYAHLLGQLGVTPEQSPLLVQRLVDVEVAAELASTRPLPTGRALLERAKMAGKRVVLISDTYLARAALEAMLARAGVRGYDCLYVSSEEKVCKRSGALFHRVREREGQPRTWLHIGDDRFSDERVPARLGLATYRVPSISERYLEDPYVAKQFPSLAGQGDHALSIVHGLVSRKFLASVPPASSPFAGSSYRIGYAAGGPLLAGFAVWLNERIARDGVTDVYFLARDGLLPMQCLELLFAGRPLPRLHYLYASRRLYALPALRTLADLTALAGRKFQAGPIGGLLESRFGIPRADLDVALLQMYGFASAEQRVDGRDVLQRAAFEALIVALAPQILAIAERERSLLTDYLVAAGFFDRSRSIAVVDIGHNASLQQALSVIAERSDIRGYYFATYREARAVQAGGLAIDSYMLEFEDAEASSHPYCRGVGMFEFLFLPPLRSIAGLRRGERGFEALLVEGDESRRMALSAEVHQGVRDFVSDVRSACLGYADQLQLAKSDALAPYAAFVAAPQRADAELFEGVAFVDAFGGFAQRFLVPQRPATLIDGAAARAFLSQAWWKEGARAVASLPHFDLPEFKFGLPAWEKKLRKLQRDPELFFLDARAKPLRWVGRGLLAAARLREALTRRG